MANNWRNSSIGKHFQLINGYAFKSNDFVKAGCPVIKIKNIKAGFFSEHEFSYVDPAFLEIKNDKVPQLNDLLISMSGNRHDGSPETWVGKVAFFNRQKKYLINQRVGALRLIKQDELDSRYMSYLLSSWPYQKLFISIATSSGGQANLSPGQILGAAIRYPSLFEQCRIANILGSLDDKIEQNRQMNETLEAMAQVVFKSWFIDFDPVIDRVLEAGNELPGALQEKAALRLSLDKQRKALLPKIDTLFPDEFVETELGWIPKGWVIAPLSNLTTELRRGICPKYSEEGIRVVNQRCIRNHEINWNCARRHDTAKKKISERLLRPGDLLINSTGVGTLGRMAPVIELEEPTVADSHVTIVRPDFRKYTPFLFARLMLTLEPLVETMGEGSTGQTELNRINVGNLLVVVPPKAIQDVAESYFRGFFEQVSVNCRNIQTLSTLRDCLLPKLISGEILLPAAEDILAEAIHE